MNAVLSLVAVRCKGKIFWVIRIDVIEEVCLLDDTRLEPVTFRALSASTPLDVRSCFVYKALASFRMDAVGIRKMHLSYFIVLAISVSRCSYA